MPLKTTQQLLESHPLILGKLIWGLEFGAGWNNVVDALCHQLAEPVAQLEKELKQLQIQRARLPHDQREWTREQRRLYGDAAMDALKKDLRRARRALPKPIRIKEKLGRLRFQTGKVGEGQRALIRLAERMAATTCELCGNPGELREVSAWYKTLCDQHFNSSGAPPIVHSRMPWRVVEVRPLSNFRLRVRFADGLEGDVDMSALVNSPSAGVFAKLADASEFARVFVERGVVTWPCEIDLAPDAMHESIKRTGIWVLR